MIRFSDVYVAYRNGTRALRGVSLIIEDGEFVFVVGPSGAGKSTLVKLMTAELLPTEGLVEVNSFKIDAIRRREMPLLRRTIGVVYQDFRLIERKNVYENVAFAMRVTGASPEQIRKRVPKVLELVGLSRKRLRRPQELSGGEQQRVAIARALVNSPRLIIADEPTGNLDPERSQEIMRLLEEINAMGTTVVVITHEKGLVDSLDKRVVALEHGHIISDKTGGYYRNETL